MKAVVIRKHGGVEALEIADVPMPKPSAGEVLVKVHAAALNHLDIWLRMGRPGVSFQFPHVMGSDAAGVVVETGAGIAHVSAGDEVLLNPGLSCGACAWCERGEQSECPSFSILGMGKPGTFAEYVTCPAGNVQPKPAHLTWAEAAALPLAHLTAWRMLVTRAALRPGETLLIHGIGGGVALAGLQLATILGAETIVTSSSEEKLARAGELGASHGLNYARIDALAGPIMELTGGRGVDVVLDTVGAATWPINFEVLRKGGRAVHCGVTAGPQVATQLSALYWKQLSILGSTMGSHEDFRALVRCVAATGLRPVVDSVHPLDAARTAQERMENGRQFGKIVLEVSS